MKRWSFRERHDGLLGTVILVLAFVVVIVASFLLFKYTGMTRPMGVTR